MTRARVLPVLLLVGAVLGLLTTAREARAEEPAAPAKLTAAELETLVGPVALYPDIVIASLLPATTAPLDVVAAARAVEQAGGKVAEVPAGAAWDPSVQALLQFPDVLLWMNQNLEWVKQTGYAVATQQADVLAAIQEFRRKAAAAGNLKSDEHMTVTTADAPAAPAEAAAPPAEVIVIEPTDPTVVYVPTYSPTAVVAPSYSGWAFGVGVAVGVAGAWAYHNIAWGSHDHVSHHGSISVSNTVNFNGNVNWTGVNRPAAWRPTTLPATRPTGTLARPSQPMWGSAPGAGRPGGAGAGVRPPSTMPARGGGAGLAGGPTRPSQPPRLGGGGPAAGGLPAGGPPGGGLAGGGLPGGVAPRPATLPTRAPSGFGSPGNGLATRQASERGNASLRASPGGGRAGFGGGRGGGGRGGRGLR